MAHVMIRPVEAADRAGWLPLWMDYQTFYQRADEEDVTQATWTRFLDPDEPVHAVVAEDRGRLVGLAHSIVHRSTWTVAPVCYLHDLYVTPELRGQGVGRALIEAVHRSARQLGIAGLYWLTHETNGTARRLYDHVAERSGFIHYSKTRP